MAATSSPSPRVAALTDALLGIVAERGLDEVSVREVAAAAGVSVGTVQHYFPTKDAMLASAFEEVVRRIQSRVWAVPLGSDIRRNLSAVLSELLPLDERRAREVRIQMAFAARAAISPPLAAIQRTVLEDVTDQLSQAFALAWGERAGTAARCRRAAQAALAVTDGLALHGISSGGWPPPQQLTAAVELVLDALIGTG